jgi:hypothetical protein
MHLSLSHSGRAFLTSPGLKGFATPFSINEQAMFFFENLEVASKTLLLSMSKIYIYSPESPYHSNSKHLQELSLGRPSRRFYIQDTTGYPQMHGL